MTDKLVYEVAISGCLDFNVRSFGFADYYEAASPGEALYMAYSRFGICHWMRVRVLGDRYWCYIRCVDASFRRYAPCFSCLSDLYYLDFKSFWGPSKV